MKYSAPRLLSLLLASALIFAACAPARAIPPPPSPRPATHQPLPPLPATNQPPPPPEPPLTSDFEFCPGHPSGGLGDPSSKRLLLAWSADGLNFQRPVDPGEGFIADRVNVADAVLLPSGRILVYFVTFCRSLDGVQQGSNNIAVALSDRKGEPGSWVFKDVKLTGLPAEYGTVLVDPNVVLLPDGSLSLFTSAFWDMNGSQQAGTAAFLSTDGGFTYSYRALVYQGLIDPENFRFSPDNWQIITGESSDVRGIALSTDDGQTFNPFGTFPGNRVVHELAVTDSPGVFRAYVSTSDGIISYISSMPPWTDWQEEPGFRLQVDPSTGLESCNVSFPTVLKLAPGLYLMIYEAVQPGCNCDELHPACE